MDDQQGTQGAIKGGEVRLRQMQEQIEQMQFNSEALSKIIGNLRLENMKLKARATNQRLELRRLNRRLSAMWEGVRFSHKGKLVPHKILVAEKEQQPLFTYNATTKTFVPFEEVPK